MRDNFMRRRFENFSVSFTDKECDTEALIFNLNATKRQNKKYWLKLKLS